LGHLFYLLYRHLLYCHHIDRAHRAQFL